MFDAKEFVAAVGDDPNTFGWLPSYHVDEVAALLEPDEKVEGFLVEFVENPKSHDRTEWHLWMITNRGLVHFEANSDEGTTGASKFARNAVARTNVRTVGLEKTTFDGELEFYVKNRHAVVTFFDGSSLEFDGKDWLNSWRKPTDRAVQGAVAFFDALGRLSQ